MAESKRQTSLAPWRKKARAVLEANGWTVRSSSDVFILKRGEFRTTLYVTHVSGCTCGNVRFSMNTTTARVPGRLTFVHPTGPHIELTFAPSDEETVLAYLVKTLDACSVGGKTPELCPTVPAVMETRYQFTEAGSELCKCFARTSVRAQEPGIR